MHSLTVKLLARIALLALVLFALMHAFAYLHMRAMRRARIWNDKLLLERAYGDFAHTGVVTNEGVSICTNVVTVAGSNYTCVLAADHPFYGGQGILAMTSNKVFIWLDKTRGTKIIDGGYRPPLFPPGY